MLRPSHHCDVRASVGKDTPPTFSVTVRKPEQANPEWGSADQKERRPF